MPIKFTDCYVVQTDVKHDAYKKKNAFSGHDEDRVKIKTSQVKDCRRVSITNEGANEDTCDDLGLLADDKEKNEEKQDHGISQEMGRIMESFRRFQKTLT